MPEDHRDDEMRYRMSQQQNPRGPFREAFLQRPFLREALRGLKALWERVRGLFCERPSAPEKPKGPPGAHLRGLSGEFIVKTMQHITILIIDEANYRRSKAFREVLKMYVEKPGFVRIVYRNDRGVKQVTFGRLYEWLSLNHPLG